MPKVTKKTVGRHSVGRHSIRRHSINCRGRLIDLTVPAVMGILNVTPDSFFSGSRVGSSKTGDPAAALAEVADRAGKMLDDGATFLDIGGYSTRPGAAAVSATEEADRILPIIESILAYYPDALLSVDTFRASVARQAVDAGASMINDVAGGTLDPAMFETVATLGVPYVLMHLRGTPQTMQSLTTYQDVVTEVIDEVANRLAGLRTKFSPTPHQPQTSPTTHGPVDVILDPGFGFAKTPAQNFELLGQLDAFRLFDEPLLIGLSRKTTVWKTLNVTADEALNGTTVLNTIALMKGAAILRVHDVREAVEAVKLTQHLTFF